MGGPSGSPDIVDAIGCSDQRFVFKLVLREARSLRKALFSASVQMAQGKHDEASKIINEALGKSPIQYEWNERIEPWTGASGGGMGGQ